tara:strand:- start:38 stop:211 length:174 start_codon:yes stop_codon:yes gene_type:complete
MEKTDFKKIENINTDLIEHILKTKYGWDYYPLPIIRINKKIEKNVVQLIEYKKKIRK